MKEIPIRKQLVLVKLCPGFDQPLLPLRNRSGDQRDRRNRKHCDMLLIIESVRGKKKHHENARDIHCVCAEIIISADAAQEIREMRARDIDGGGRAAKMVE